MCPIVMFFFTNGNRKFVFNSSVLFTGEGDENDTQRKKLKTDDYAKIVTKFGRLKTYISTNRLNKCTATNSWNLVQK